MVDRQLDYTDRLAVEARTSTRDPAISTEQSDCSIEVGYSNGLVVSARGMGAISINRKQFVVHLNLNVKVNGQEQFEKSWLKMVPRNYV
jgi:hypothetical protein